MVNMNIARSYGSIALFETEAANDTRAPIIIYAGLTGSATSFVPVHEHPMAGTFPMVIWSEFIRSPKDSLIVGFVSQRPKYLHWGGINYFSRSS